MDTRDRVLAAASELFAEHGYDGASVRMIAEQAEANQAAVNYYFGCKDELFREVVRSQILEVRGVMASTQSAPGSYGERLRVLVRGLVEKLWERRRLVRIIADAMLHGGDLLPEAAREELPKNMGVLRGVLEEGVRNGALGACDPTLVAWSLLSALLHMAVFGEIVGQAMGLDFSDPSVRAAFAEQHCRMVVGGLTRLTAADEALDSESQPGEC